MGLQGEGKGTILRGIHLYVVKGTGPSKARDIANLLKQRAVAIKALQIIALHYVKSTCSKVTASVSQMQNGLYKLSSTS